MLPHHRGSVARRRVPSSESRSCLAMLWQAFARLHVAMRARRRAAEAVQPTREPRHGREHTVSPRSVADPRVAPGSTPGDADEPRTRSVRGCTHQSTRAWRTTHPPASPLGTPPSSWLQGLAPPTSWSRPPAVRRSVDLRPSMGLDPPRGSFARARGARHGRGRELRSTLTGEIPPRFAAGCRSSRLRPSGRTVRPSRVAA